MTLRDSFELIKRNIKYVIAVPIICVVLSIGWTFLTQGFYTATANFATSGDLALAQGFANTEAASYSNAEVQVSCSSVSSSKQIVIKTTGTDSGKCIQVANEVASNTTKRLKEANNAVVTTMNEASSAIDNRIPTFRNVFIAAFAGLLLAICAIFLIDAIRVPVKSCKDIRDVSDFPILGDASTLEGCEQILANLQFRCDGRPATVAVVPVGTSVTSPIVAKGLANALERSDVRVKLVKGSPHAKKFQVNVPSDAAIIVSCEPFDEGIGAAYIAHGADATVLCVGEWTDSRRQVVATVQELELAKANIAGIAYLPEEKKHKEPRRAKDPEGE